jgi:4a-hydroxytetrahydrobiopterin dehydratase
LAGKTCVPCTGEISVLEGARLGELSVQVPGWQVGEGHHLKRKFGFADFGEALEFVNWVSRIAEEQGHHPEIAFGWGYADVTTFTHRMDGLTDNDFILAAKIDEI